MIIHILITIKGLVRLERCIPFIMCALLKGQCLEIFDLQLFSLKHYFWAPYKQVKQFRELFLFHNDIQIQSFRIGCTHIQ